MSARAFVTVSGIVVVCSLLTVWELPSAWLVFSLLCVVVSMLVGLCHSFKVDREVVDVGGATAEGSEEDDDDVQIGDEEGPDVVDTRHSTPGPEEHTEDWEIVFADRLKGVSSGTNCSTGAAANGAFLSPGRDGE